MEIAIAIVVIFVGAYVQSSIGFGLAIISAPVLFLVNPAFVPAPIILCAFTLSLLNAYGHRKFISFRGLKFAILGRIPGTVAGGLLIAFIDQDLLALWLGLSVILAVVFSVKSFALKPSSRTMFIAGFLSGFMGTSSSIGGPPMALALQHQEVGFIRANLSAFFVVSCLMSLLMLATVGHFNVDQFMMSLPLMPATLLGYWVATHTFHLLSRQRLRFLSLGLCSLAGLAAVVSFWI